MKRLLSTLASTAALATLLAPAALAQKTPALPKPVQMSPQEFAKLKEQSLARRGTGSAYRHGQELAVTTKSGDTYFGKVVFADQSTGTLYVREAKGVAPVAIPYGDISRTSAGIQPASLEDNNKGKVIPAAIDQKQGAAAPAIDPALANEGGYEIITRKVRNGSAYTDSYYSDAISKEEREVLDKLELASERVARLEGVVAELQQTGAIRGAAQLEALQQEIEKTRSFRIFNNLNNTWRNSIETTESYRWFPMYNGTGQPFGNYGGFGVVNGNGGNGNGTLVQVGGAGANVFNNPANAVNNRNLARGAIFSPFNNFYAQPSYMEEGSRKMDIKPGVQNPMPIVSPTSPEVFDVGQVSEQLKQAEMMLDYARRDLQVGRASFGVFDDRGYLVAVRLQPRQDIAQASFTPPQTEKK